MISDIALGGGPKSIQALMPRGTVTSDFATEFRWQPFPVTAELAKYEVILFRFEPDGTRPAPIRRTSVPAGKEFTTALSAGLKPGTYAWRVEARNSQGRVLGYGQARFEITESHGNFKSSVGLNFFRISYDSNLGAAGLFSSDIPVEASGISGHLNYAITPKWAVGIEYHLYTMSLNGTGIAFHSFGFGPLYTTAVKSDPKWRLVGGLKYQSSSTPEITANSPTTFVTSSVSRTSINPTIGTEYDLTSTFMVTAHLEWIKNLSLSGGGFGPITQNQTPLGYVIGAGLLGVLNSTFGYEVDIDYFHDGFQYLTASSNPTVSFKGYNFFAAVTARF
jgi:hypothetical protein